MPQQPKMNISYSKTIKEYPLRLDENMTTKNYLLSGTLGALEVEEESIFMRLFPHLLIEKANKLFFIKQNK